MQAATEELIPGRRGRLGGLNLERFAPVRRHKSIWADQWTRTEKAVR